MDVLFPECVIRLLMEVQDLGYEEVMGSSVFLHNIPHLFQASELLKPSYESSSDSGKWAALCARALVIKSAQKHGGDKENACGEK